MIVFWCSGVLGFPVTNTFKNSLFFWRWVYEELINSKHITHTRCWPFQFLLLLRNQLVNLNRSSAINRCRQGQLYHITWLILETSVSVRSFWISIKCFYFAVRMFSQFMVATRILPPAVHWLAVKVCSFERDKNTTEQKRWYVYCGHKSTPLWTWV